MFNLELIMDYVFAFLLVLSSLAVLLVRKPVHAALCFLATLLTLASLYMRLNAPFIATMQLMVYAGAILVIFMFVVVLFQDAHEKIDLTKDKIKPYLLIAAGVGLMLLFINIGQELHLNSSLNENSLSNFGTVASIGRVLYLNFFLPFEISLLVFLIALIGAVYIAKKNRHKEIK